jgi:hypothetical protein
MRPNKKSLIAVCGLAAVGLTLALGFNSCSDVEFSKVAASSGPNDPQCVGTDCPGTVKYVNYDDDFMISAYSNKADILLVLDNSGSMRPDLLELADKLNGLVGVLDENTVDWRMCYITTNNYAGGGVLEWKKTVSGKAQSTGQKVLLPSTADKSQIFLTTIDNLPTGGTGNEQGIATMGQAIKNNLNRDCFRDDAVLSVVLISDEDEKSCGGRCENYTSNEHPGGKQTRDARFYREQYKEIGAENLPDTIIKTVKDEMPEKAFIVNAIVIRKGDYACYDSQDVEAPAFFGLTYETLQSRTGGILGDICAPSYSSQLEDMGKRTVDTVKSISLRCAPVSAPTVTITPASPTTTWTVAGDKILFSQALPQGSVVNVKYTCAEK